MSTRKLVKAVKALFKPTGKPSPVATGSRGRKAARSNRKLVRTVNNLIRPIGNLSRDASRQARQTVRTMLFTGRRRSRATSGFVLPTVVMVMLVVILLTTAIVFRSFDRSKNASNFRVSEAALNASTPALDRARVKIEKILADAQSKTNATPSDVTIKQTIDANINDYTFGDETLLRVSYDINGDGSIALVPPVGGGAEDIEAIPTAWRFPVDTDNNGKYDTYTIYEINFRSPSRNLSDGKFNRARSPLETRTPPMDNSIVGGVCAAARGTSASLVGESGWYKSGAALKRSFFVYVATVPITTTPTNQSSYEKYTGNKSFSSLEFQQDEQRLPISSDAVVYQDDLQITPGAGLRLNGRVFTNSNLLTGQPGGNRIRFFQVSSAASCFYLEENSRIYIGGNLGNGRATTTGEGEGQGVQVDLFDPSIKPPTSPGSGNIDSSSKSASNTARDMGFNSQAYAKRIDKLVTTYISSTPADPTSGFAATDPSEVQSSIKTRLSQDSTLDKIQVRQQEVQKYFEKRTRHVPFKDIDFGLSATANFTSLGGSGDALRPQDNWMYPTDPSTGQDYTGLTLLNSQPPATEPTKQQDTLKGLENNLGDRILIGNNLPARWYDPQLQTQNKFADKKVHQQLQPATAWTVDDPGKKNRYRTTQVDQIINIDGITDRNGDIELAAVTPPLTPIDNSGGVRVVTGAGIYVDGDAGDSAAFYPRTKLIGGVPDPNLSSFLPSPNNGIAPFWDKNFVDQNGTDSHRINANNLVFQGNPPILVWPDSLPMTGGLDAVGNPELRKGDLLMRATAVYHYAASSGTQQTPIACVSSYYDPTNSITAQNKQSLMASWKNPVADQTTIVGKSNNGIVYTFPGRTLGTYLQKLKRQAQLVFPDGRFPNEPLRTALINNAAGKALTMADNSAIDTAICAIAILDGTASPSNAIPQGAIYETAFLDARQVKAIETPPPIPGSFLYDPTNPGVLGNLKSDYSRSIEQRQPLEVRATVLDLDKLRKQAIPGAVTQEYLLPNSGIIYATRDDALLDLSDNPNDSASTRQLLSPSDYELDPTRRPHGILLVNGKDLSRINNSFRPEEKGLILATNIPAYVKGNFNLHQHEEFTEVLADDWSNFYTRINLDPDFACRLNDTRLPSCKAGDTWRSATVVADAVTILSDNFRFGFRNEGDYDLRNNQGDFYSTPPNAPNTLASGFVSYLEQGFFDNNYLTSSSWFDPTTGFPKDFDGTLTGVQGSSYVNNFVTPIQRRGSFSEYLMEVCVKVPVSTCQTSDWFVRPPDGADLGLKASAIAGLGSATAKFDITVHKAGTTVQLADQKYQRFARRVAFLHTTNPPVPLGIDESGYIQQYPYSGSVLPPPASNALLFMTTTTPATPTDPNNKSYDSNRPLFYRTQNTAPFSVPDPALATNAQPLLVPILQLQIADNSFPSGATLTPKGTALSNNWLQSPINPTTTNLLAVAGNTPGRPSEYDGGLENFVRYLENWYTPTVNNRLTGSLIQFKRSDYATAPWQTVQLDVGNNPKGISIFGSDYQQSYSTTSTQLPSNSQQGMSPFYGPPNRLWGFDVGLLSQTPDFFAEKYTQEPATPPAEYFREVGRDDQWVQTLLCSTLASDGKTPAVDADQRPGQFCKQYTGS